MGYKTMDKTFDDMANRISDGTMGTISVTFVVTEDCNLRCTYCYQQNKNKRNVMTKEIAEKAIIKLFEEEDKYMTTDGRKKAIILDFIGGEPLLEIDLIDHAVDFFRLEALKRNHFWAVYHMISISTNGTLYMDPKVEAFIDKNKERLSIGITIDGDKETHDSCRVTVNGKGSYDKVSEAVKYSIANHGSTSSKVTISPENMELFADGIIHLFDLGLSNIAANVVFEDVWELKHAVSFYKELKRLADYLLETDLYQYKTTSLFDETMGMPKNPEDNDNWCGGTGKMLGISGNGDLYPCLRYIPFNFKDTTDTSARIGNVDDGISLESDFVQDMLSITRRSQSTDECFNCPVASGCGWCSAHNYEVFGTVNKRTTFICNTHKARALANVYFWNKIYEKEEIAKCKELHIPKEWALEIINENEYNMLLELVKKQNTMQ